MISVKLREGLNYFELDGENFILKAEEVKVLPEKLFKMYEVKEALFNGRLRIVEGSILLNIKEAKVYFDSNNIIFGLENGKFFKKDLESDSIFEWILDSDISTKIPQNIFDFLMGLKDIPIIVKVEEPKVEMPLDLNKDGVVDNKDAVIASKVLNSRKKKK